MTVKQFLTISSSNKYKMYKLYVFIIFLQLREVYLQLETLSEEPGKLRYSLTQCVLSAVTEVPQRDIITISLTSKDFTQYTNSNIATDRILLNTLYQKMNWTILVAKSSNRDRLSRFFKKSDCYIIQIRDSIEFQPTLKFLKNRPSWNPHAKFIILTTTVIEEPNTFVSSLVEHLWGSRVLNAIIMVPQKEQSSKITVYSWFPFSSKNCGDGFGDSDVINICKYGIFLNSSIIFPKKIPNDMHGCPVRVRAVIWPPYIIAPEKIENYSNVNFKKGIEIMLMNTIAETANFTVIYSISKKPQDWGYISMSKTPTGLMKTLLDEKADIGLGALPSSPYRRLYLDTSVTYLEESTTWCIPHALPEPKWKCLLIIYHASTWILIFVSYVLISFGIRCVSQKEESTSYQTFGNILQNSYSIMLGITVKTLPRTTRIRIIIIIWTFVCLTLSAAYQSSLISFLTQPSFEKQIDKLEDMKEMGYNFSLVPPIFKFIRHPEKDSPLYNLPHWERCENVKECLDRTAYERDSVVGVQRMYMIYSSKTYINKRGENLVYWSKDNIVSYPVEMLMVKGYPLQKRINQIIYRINEAGLISKWIDDFFVDPGKQDNDDDDDSVILTVKHLEGCFIMLGIGLGSAALVFIFEIMYYRYKKKIK